MKSLVNKVKLFFLLSCVFLSMGCSDGEYTFESGTKLCITSEIIETNKSTTSNTYRRLLVKLEDMPADVSINYTNKLGVSRSTLLEIEDLNNTKYKFDHYEELFSSASTPGSLSYDEELSLYRLEYESESAMRSYDYLKIDPHSEGLNKQPQNLKDWYLGFCVEGIGERPDSCRIYYIYNDLILSFEVVKDSLYEWQAILNKVNSSVDNWKCE